MNYKKVFSNFNSRLAVLKALDWIPDKLMIRLQFFLKYGRFLSLKNPRRFTEKLQWYKLYYRDELMRQCTDKFEVRENVRKLGLGNILTECYGIYDKAEDIDVSALPNSFVAKLTSGAAAKNVYFCKDKSKLDYEDMMSSINRWLNAKTCKGGREWSYYNIKPRIIIEEYLVDEDQPDEQINDYKLMCFNGEPYVIWVDIDRNTEHKRVFYSLDWKYINVQHEYINAGDIAKKPKLLNELIQYARILSKPFPHVRVDLYCTSSSIHFGELTFYSSSGYGAFRPDSFDLEMGEKFSLPQRKGV